MQSIVCQVDSQPDRIGFTWSQGGSSFEPYYLTGDLAKDFIDDAKQLRTVLAHVVITYLDCAQRPDRADEHRRACFRLARVGNDIFKAVFDPGESSPLQKLVAGEAKRWLQQLLKVEETLQLEIVQRGSSPLAVPWNVVYDATPDQKLFEAGGESLGHWLPFWGVRYNLTCGPPVDPRRRMPWWQPKPRLWMVVNPQVQEGLPASHRDALDDFRKRHDPVWIETAAELEGKLEAGKPDLMYWLCHADPNALYLRDGQITPRLLRRWMRAGDDATGTAGLVFLNACQTAEAGEAGSFLETFYHLGMCGLIATEHQTIDTFASPFGLAFLDAFLNDGAAVGPTLHRLRRQVPLGLLYAAFCPSDVRVLLPQPVRETDAPVRAAVVQPGSVLGAPPHAAEPTPLPERPYQSLHYYDRADRALFAGRDADVRRFARLLDEPATRMLVLQGESGVGKSSFLRAGVILYLEECVGYKFARDRSGIDNEAVLFIRATSDLVGQIADGLCRYCSKPFVGKRPGGKEYQVDLPKLLREAVGLKPDGSDAGRPRGVRDALRRDPALFGRLLTELDRVLPYSLVLVIDQGEEIFTLARTAADEENRRVAIDALRRAVAVRGSFKIIVALRTEYYGRLADALNSWLDESDGVREYLLKDFSEADLVEAITRPTRDTPIPYASDVPFEKYRFRYDDGVAREVVKQVSFVAGRGSDSVLPLFQVVCTQLYDLARERAEASGTWPAVIRKADLASIGGAEGGIRKHAEQLVAKLFRGAAPRARRRWPAGRGRKALLEREETAFRKMMRRLYRTQPDGGLTTEIVPVEQLRALWTGRTDFDRMLADACSPKYRLLRRSQVLMPDQTEPREYVSLGHDALAPVAAAWHEQLRWHAELWDAARRAIALCGVAACVIIALGALNFWVARKQMAQTLGERIKLSNQFNAEAGASAAGYQIRRRWWVLTDAANDWKLQRALARAREAKTQPGAHPAREELQRWLEEAADASHDLTGADYWSVLDADGVQQARTGVGKENVIDTRGQRLGWRDYFHGSDQDYDDVDGVYQPNRIPHVSIPFLAKSVIVPKNDELNTDQHQTKLRIAFSVPIPDKTTRQPIGVLSLMVDPTRFVLLTTSSKVGDPKDSMMAFLLDKHRYVLRHPALEDYLRNSDNLPKYEFKPADMIKSPNGFVHFENPLGPPGDNRGWIAYAARVTVPKWPGVETPPKLDWYVVAQEPQRFVAKADEVLSQALLNVAYIVSAVVLVLILVFSSFKFLKRLAIRRPGPAIR